jgi:hypothetical protein
MRSLPASLLPLVGCAFFVAVVSPTRADDKRPSGVAELLKAKDFWQTTGLRDGRKWTDGEVEQLRGLVATSPDAVVRLRGDKILADLDKKGRFGAKQEAIVTAGFRYLEKNLKTAPVKTLCVEQGLTHYTVSTKSDGTLWLLVEHVESKGFNGGLNLKWDGTKKDITKMEAWGNVPAE